VKFPLSGFGTGTATEVVISIKCSLASSLLNCDTSSSSLLTKKFENNSMTVVSIYTKF